MYSYPLFPSYICPPIPDASYLLQEREELEQQEEQRRRQYEAEMARLEREAKEREEQRRREEHKEIQRKVAKERLEQLKNTAVGAKAFADLSEDAIADMDVDDILAKQVEQLEKEKKELQDKLKSQEKRVSAQALLGQYALLPWCYPSSLICMLLGRQCGQKAICLPSAFFVIDPCSLLFHSGSNIH